MAGKDTLTLRNSPLRHTFSPITKKATDLLAEKVHPDTITLIGASIRAAMSIWSAIENSHSDRKPRYRALRLTLLTTFAFSDALDGPIARRRQELGLPISPYGDQLDGLCDRLSNVITGICHAYSADKRQDLFAKLAGLSYAATAGLSSWSKQLAAKEGVAVPEFGTGLALFGNHVARSTLGIVGDILPQSAGPLDWLSTLGNLASTHQHLQAAKSEIPNLNATEKQNARKMAALYSITTILGILAAGSAFFLFRQPHRKSE
jgi:phosphatidylglycerophosphate synthase